MYALCWEKPFGVEDKTFIPFDYNAEFYSPCYRLDTPSAISEYRVREVETNDFYYEFLDVEGQLTYNSLVLYGSATVFSALHIAAWNWTFLSPVARTLWRSFSVAATGASFVLMLTRDNRALLEDWNRNALTRGLFLKVWNTYSATRGLFLKLGGKHAAAKVIRIYLTIVFCYGGIFVYVVSRLGLIFLIFYSFSSMPAGVYETVGWTKHLPHFG